MSPSRVWLKLCKGLRLGFTTGTFANSGLLVDTYILAYRCCLCVTWLACPGKRDCRTGAQVWHAHKSYGQCVQASHSVEDHGTVTLGNASVPGQAQARPDMDMACSMPTTLCRSASMRRTQKPGQAKANGNGLSTYKPTKTKMVSVC